MARATTHRTTIIGALVAAVLVMGGCGGGDSDEAVEDMISEAASEAAAADNEESESTTETTRADEPELEPLAFPLPEESEPPEGFEVVPANCVSPEQRGGAYSFAVPEAWEASGWGGGGSGSPLGTATDTKFTVDEGTVSIETDPDSRPPNGPVLDESGEPFVSFDYDYSIDQEVTTITFDPVETVTVGDQEVEIFVAEQSQAPEVISSTEYKARLELAELPNPAPGDKDGIRHASMVVTITHDAEETTLDAETATAIIESFAMPQCTRDQIIVGRELLLQMDINDDGHVSGPEDL